MPRLASEAYRDSIGADDTATKAPLSTEQQKYATEAASPFCSPSITGIRWRMWCKPLMQGETWVSKPTSDQSEAATPAMEDDTLLLILAAAVQRKKVTAVLDGGHLASDRAVCCCCLVRTDSLVYVYRWPL